VRRFIFSNKIPFSELAPAEMVALNSMRPDFASGANVTPDKTATPVLMDGK